MASGVGKKKVIGIHRTTSETLRLGELDILDETVHIPSSIRSNLSLHHARKKVQSSFQITEVCITRPDGEESADDLDESHTDDNSRVTDNETPSFSEDSREEHALNPTVSQISTASSTAPISSASTKSQTNNSKTISSDSSNFNSFSRGRWTCMDYIDNKQQHIDMEISNNEDFVGQYLRRSSELKNCKISFEHKFQEILRFGQNEFNFGKEVGDAYRKVANLLTTNKAKYINSSGGESSVAIDSKIEQAMDLVKRHLMYAVRQDVNVLKLKISELLVRISQLESENLYLRAKASPEVLTTLERKKQPI